MNNLLTYWEDYLLEFMRFPSMPIHDLVLLVLDQHPTIIWHSIEEISSQIKRDAESIKPTIEALVRSNTVHRMMKSASGRFMYASKARLIEKHANSKLIINPATWELNEEMAFREADSEFDLDHPMYQKRDDKPSSGLPPLNTNPFSEVEATLLQTISIVQIAENLNKAISQLKLAGEKLLPYSPQS